MISFSFLKNNQRGFTILEFVIAMGISTMVIGVATFILEDNKKFQRILGQKVERAADLTLGRSLLYKDLRNAAPTFYFYSKKGDFYTHADKGEIQPENCVTIGGTEIEFFYTTTRPSCSGVEIVLEDVGDKLEVLAENTNLGKGSLIVSPEDIYTGNSLSKAKLVQLLFDNGLTFTSDESDALGTFKIQASSALMIGTQMRTYGAVFDLSTMSLVNLDTLYTIPEDFCKVANLSSGKIETLDDFLKCLPGSGIPRVKLTPVTTIKYEIKFRRKEKSEVEGEMLERDVKYLERTSTRVGRSDVGVGLFENIARLRFYRTNTSSTSVFIDAKFNTVKNK